MKKDRKRNLNNKGLTLGARIKNILSHLWKKGKEPLTVMVAPHNETKILHFRVSLLLLWILGFTAIALITGVIIFSTGYLNKSTDLAKQSRQNSEMQANFQDITNQANEAAYFSVVFAEALDKTLDTIDGNADKKEATDGGGDINSINNTRIASSNSDMEQFAKLKGVMEESIPKLKELKDKFDSQKKLLSEMPTKWPAQNRQGRQVGFLTLLFGPTRDPFTGDWQFHTGADIAFESGVPLVAAANGTVVKTAYNAGGYGNYVIVRHNYGFYTRYAHMQRYSVKPGQVVKQGDFLGYLGSTGRVTGPHVHFEVMIGTEVVDPMRYLSINNQAYSRYIRNNGDSN